MGYLVTQTTAQSIGSAVCAEGTPHYTSAATHPLLWLAGM